jgi:hypothetical protein
MELLQERRKYYESNSQFMRARSWLALGIAGFVLFFFLMAFVPMVVLPAHSATVALATVRGLPIS